VGGAEVEGELGGVVARLRADGEETLEAGLVLGDRLLEVAAAEVDVGDVRARLDRAAHVARFLPESGRLLVGLRALAPEAGVDEAVPEGDERGRLVGEAA